MNTHIIQVQFIFPLAFGQKLPWDATVAGRKSRWTQLSLNAMSGRKCRGANVGTQLS